MNKPDNNFCGPLPEPEARRILRRQARVLACAAIIWGVCFAVLNTESGWGLNIGLSTLLWLGCLRFCLGRLGLWQRRHLPWLLGAAALGLVPFWSDSLVTSWFSPVGALILSGLWLLDALAADGNWTLGQYVQGLFALAFAPLARFSALFRDLAELRKTPAEGRGRLRPVLLGLLIALPLAALVLALLGSADAVFGDMLSRLIPEPGTALTEALTRLLKALLWAAVTALWLYGMLASQTERPVSPVAGQPRRGSAAVAIGFTGVLGAIYLIFCAVQIIYLFAGQGTLPEGYTYAAYAREGFFQLWAVTALNLLLILICGSFFTPHPVLKGLLTGISVCTCVMLASAAYRMSLYVGEYGFTAPRLLCLWSLAVVAVLTTGTTVWLYRPGLRLRRFWLVTCVCLWLVLAYARPDALVTRYNLTALGGYYACAEAADTLDGCRPLRLAYGDSCPEDLYAHYSLLLDEYDYTAPMGWRKLCLSYYVRPQDDLTAADRSAAGSGKLYGRIVRYLNRHQEELTAACQAYLQTDGYDERPEFNGMPVSVRCSPQQRRSVEFLFRTTGPFLSETEYCFYYSPDNAPMEQWFDTADAGGGWCFPLDTVSDDEWVWRGDGDNGGRMCRITDCWFYAERWW